VLDRTPFFSQAGGQVADVGALALPDGAGSFRVNSVQSYGGYVLHVGTLDVGRLAVGARVDCSVEWGRRLEISKSHTLTHMMNLALHQVLGDGVSQKGSLVDESKARFDFSHSQAMTPSECARVEELVRESVGAQLPVDIQTVPLDKALAINNLRAVFGERYPDPVRVVSIGPTVPELLAAPDEARWDGFSIELCGGSHVPKTDSLGGFALVDESAVAKGVRRVVGVTGQLAADAVAAGAALSSRLDALTSSDVGAAAAADVDGARKALTQLKLDVDASTTSIHLKAGLRAAIGAHDKLLQKRAKALSAEGTNAASAAVAAAASEAATAGKAYVVLEIGGGLEVKAMQPLVQRAIKESAIAVMVLSAAADKVSCVAAVPNDRLEQLPANEWLQQVLSELNGRGGGKPAQAQGSGTELAAVPRALEIARSFANEALTP